MPDSFSDAKPSPLQGKLLLAAPSLREPTFARTVIYLVRHSKEEGALGYIINKPFGQKLGEIAPIPELQPLAETDVLVGGPVQQNQLSFLSLHWNEASLSLDCQFNLQSRSAVRFREEGFTVMGLLGYAGWSPGQLEDELNRQSWIVREADETVLGLPRDSGMWSALLTGMGPVFQLLSGIPENVYWN